ncbi:hypothetical protein LB543_30195 [Mesorhizobium sp. ESP7-2]|nr:hypothetical protein [Mesorhizobium sp. ESP7-2]
MPTIPEPTVANRLVVVEALTESGIEAFFVTHLFEFAHNLRERNLPNATFLRAERQGDGTRTFKPHEGVPLQTSSGEDLYHRIFEEAEYNSANRHPGAEARTA